MQLGERDPFKMLREMPSWLMTWWKAFYETEPFGPIRDDWRSAIATSSLATALGANCKAEDFMPDFHHEQPNQSPADVLRVFASAGVPLIRGDS